MLKQQCHVSKSRVNPIERADELIHSTEVCTAASQTTWCQCFFQNIPRHGLKKTCSLFSTVHAGFEQFSDHRSRHSRNGQLLEGADGDKICQNQKNETSRLKSQVLHVLLFISFLLSGLFINCIQLLLFIVVVRWFWRGWNQNLRITDLGEKDCSKTLENQYFLYVIEAC